jgi:hypothetical protein
VAYGARSDPDCGSDRFLVALWMPILHSESSIGIVWRQGGWLDRNTSCDTLDSHDDESEVHKDGGKQIRKTFGWYLKLLKVPLLSI